VGRDYLVSDEETHHDGGAGRTNAMEMPMFGTFRARTVVSEACPPNQTGTFGKGRVVMATNRIPPFFVVTVLPCRYSRTIGGWTKEWRLVWRSCRVVGAEHQSLREWAELPPPVSGTYWSFERLGVVIIIYRSCRLILPPHHHCLLCRSTTVVEC
jgi:hypothetical protein